MSAGPDARDGRPPVPAEAAAPGASTPRPAPAEPAIERIEREVEGLTVPRRSLFEAEAPAPSEALLGVRRANPLAVVVGALRAAWGLIALAAFAVARDFLLGDLGTLGTLAGASAVILAGCLALSWASWRARTWELADEGIVLRWGILSRRRLRVPYEHVHTIQMNSGLLERLFGLIKLDFDTGAAAAEGEATTIDGLRAGEAEALREEIFRRKRLALGEAPAEGAAGEAAALEGERPAATYRLEGRELLLAAASQTSAVSQAVALLVLLANGANQLIEWGVLDLVGAGDELLRVPLATVVPVVAAALLLAIALGALASFAINLVRYSGFRVERFVDRVTVEHGLVSRSSRTLALERVQFVTVRQGLVRQLIGYAEVRAHVVAAAGEGEPSGAALLHPFVRTSELDAFLSEVLPAYAGVLDAAELGRLGPVARRRAVVRAVAWWLCVLAIMAAALWLSGVAGLLGDIAWLLRPLLVLAAVASLVTLTSLVADALRGCSAARYGHTARELVLVSGGLTRVTALVPRARLQHMTVSRSPFQRRAGVATLSARTASVNADGLRLRDLPEAEASALLAWFRPRG